jgi:site-specific DNA-cytosine methylase
VKYTTANIVPLIGGLALGQAEAFGDKPKFIQSYAAFANNDQHIKKWWPKIPFEVIDEELKEGEAHKSLSEYVDVIGSVCPCAGLSSLSGHASVDSATNDWLYITSEHVLSTIVPRVYWGENAPALSSAKGLPVAMKLKEIGDKYGYSFSMYRTKSELHGLPQIRQRTFFFFWKGLNNEVPLLPFIDKPHVTIDEFFRRDRPKDKFSELTLRQDKPSDLPVYRFILEKLGVDHVTFVKEKIDSTAIMSHYLMSSGLIDECIGWLRKNGFDKETKRVEFWKKKLNMGTGVMDRYLLIPKGVIGAFVGQVPFALAHPFEDRFLNIREMCDLMAMPLDYTFIDPIRHINHLAQNVPVCTARDIALLIKDYLAGKLRLVESGDAPVVYDNISKKLVGTSTVRQKSIF